MRWAKLGMRERRRAVEHEGKVVHVAVPPVLAGLVRLDQWVLFGVVVRGGVAIRRVVAAADMAAVHAHAQVHPLPTDPQAVLAAGAARLDVAYVVEMRACI